MKKALVVRYGAYGDAIIITPVLKALKAEGYYVIVNCNKRTAEVLQNNPNVDEYIHHDESIHIDTLHKHWEKLKEDVKPDKFINFSESIECNVALHPINPEYIYPKYERFEKCNKNYYEETFRWAGLKVPAGPILPDLYFTDEELKQAESYIKKDKYNILWSLSGSGNQKVYPWAEYVIGEILKNHDDVHIITVGDLKCQLLETLVDKDITHLAGEIPMRISMALTRFVNLVVSPDTGVLHAAGGTCTPKIGLLGHTTKVNITSQFIFDYSIEADCACAPCFRLIYDHHIQCPIDVVTHAAWCMAIGIPPERLYERIITCRKETRQPSLSEALSCMLR